ncbi:hypothetical protein M513_07401, partial [Trichuris suis]
SRLVWLGATETPGYNAILYPLLSATVVKYERAATVTLSKRSNSRWLCHLCQLYYLTAILASSIRSGTYHYIRVDVVFIKVWLTVQDSKIDGLLPFFIQPTTSCSPPAGNIGNAVILWLFFYRPRQAHWRYLATQLHFSFQL